MPSASSAMACPPSCAARQVKMSGVSPTAARSARPDESTVAVSAMRSKKSTRHSMTSGRFATTAADSSARRSGVRATSGEQISGVGPPMRRPRTSITFSCFIRNAFRSMRGRPARRVARSAGF